MSDLKNTINIPTGTSLEEAADMLVLYAKERFKNRYLMLHGDDGSEVQDAAGNSHHVVQSWRLFSTKTKKNALDPIIDEIFQFILKWENLNSQNNKELRAELLRRYIEKATAKNTSSMGLASELIATGVEAKVLAALYAPQKTAIEAPKAHKGQLKTDKVSARAMTGMSFMGAPKRAPQTTITPAAEAPTTRRARAAASG